MKSVQRDAVVTRDGKVQLSELPFSPGQRVKVYLWEQDNGDVEGLTVGDLLASDFIGVWADREDMEDSPAFARTLRESLERRDWPGDDAPGH